MHLPIRSLRRAIGSPVSIRHLCAGGHLYRDSKRVKLEAVWIPRTLLGIDVPANSAFDLEIVGRRVQAMKLSTNAARRILLSGLVDAHTHIDKNYTVREVGAARGNLFDAIQRMKLHHAAWTSDAFFSRMERALTEAWRSGTRALRTHLDWPTVQAPASLQAFERLRDEWAGRIELQFVSLTSLDMFADHAASESIAREVARARGILGAFVYRNENIADKLDRVFDLAEKYGLSLDFHVDEGLDAAATGLHTIAKMAILRHFPGRVVCGHACSLSMQDEASAHETLALCAQADIHLVALPTTNLYLQGAWDRTPIERGITRIREAAARGVRASLATDNVQDAFYPFGGYDLLETFGLGVQMAHLTPAIEWLDAITLSPARAMGLAWDGRIAPGCPADLVLLEAADEHELMDRRGRRRTVIRAGEILENIE